MTNAAIPRSGYAALVDIMLATIGIFVIVFVLQDLSPPQALQPAAVDGVVICAVESLVLHRAGMEPLPIGTRDIAAPLIEAFSLGGRIWVAIEAQCAFEGGMAEVTKARGILAELASDGNAAPLVLELAPLGTDGHDALLARLEQGA